MSLITLTQELCTPVYVKNKRVLLKDTPFELKDNRLRATTYAVIKAHDDGQLIGALVAGVYPTNHLYRCSQWLFRENANRCLWIDRIDVAKEYQGRGIGRRLLSTGEGFLRSAQLPDSAKNNMYMVSIISAIPFYLSNGWKMILTPGHKEEEDYPCIYMAEHAVWMVKPVQGDLEGEKDYFSEYQIDLNDYVQYFHTGIEDLDNEIYDRFIKEGELSLLDNAICIGYRLDVIKKVYQRMLEAIDRCDASVRGPHILINACVVEREDWRELRDWLLETFPREQLGELVTA